MKLAFLMILLLAALANAQQAQKQTDAQLVAELQAAKNRLYECYDAFWKDTGDPKRDALAVCREKAGAELGEIYARLSRRPDALKMLLALEMNDRYRESSARLKGVGASKTETALESSAELQRIIVLQNQRIIELLEKLAANK